MIPVDILGLSAFAAILVGALIGGLIGAVLGGVLVVAFFSLIIRS